MIRKIACRLALTTVLLTTTAPLALAQTAPTPERREVGTLVYDGVPAIPPTLRPQTQRYRNARAASFEDWLTDGSMLITTRFGETAQVHRDAQAEVTNLFLRDVFSLETPAAAAP